MQSWLVLLYYAMLAFLCIFTYYVLGITWWSSFNLSLLLVFVTLVFTTPEISLAPGQTADAVLLFLLALLAFAAPIFLFVYVISQALQDQADRFCVVEAPEL